MVRREVPSVSHVLWGQKEKRHKGELPIGRVAKPALTFLMEELGHLAGSQV